MALSGMNASLLIAGSSDDTQYLVNLDPQLLELIQEAKYLQKMNLEIPEAANLLMSSEDRIKHIKELYVRCCCY